jgi:hypothetical protein
MYLLGRRYFQDERGSISVLIIGLFTILLTTAMILTDISAIYLAKRSLTLITESGVQRGMKNLDKESYYSGEYNLSQMAANMLGNSEEDPGIPIDCRLGSNDAYETVANGNDFQSPMSRANLKDIRITHFECDGFQIYLEASATAVLPVPIPFINMREIGISTHAGAIGERADTNNFMGFDIG